MQKATVEDSLRQSPYTDVRQVACVVCDGVLTLRGQVTSFFHKQVALSTARQAIALEEIRNELEVVHAKDWPPSDQRLEKRGKDVEILQ